MALAALAARFIFVLVVTGAFAYTGAAFVEWSFNASTWHQTTRLGALATVLAIFAFLFK